MIYAVKIQTNLNIEFTGSLKFLWTTNDAK